MVWAEIFPSVKPGLVLSALNILFHLCTFPWDPLSQLIYSSVTSERFSHRFLEIPSSESPSYEIDHLLRNSITPFKQLICERTFLLISSQLNWIKLNFVRGFCEEPKGIWKSKCASQLNYLCPHSQWLLRTETM